RAAERTTLGRSLRDRVDEVEAANAEIQRLNAELQGRVDEATTELRHRIRELDEAKNHLEAMNAQRENFIAMVAHELTQPLSTIGGFAPLLGFASYQCGNRD